MEINLKSSWKSLLCEEINQPYFVELMNSVEEEYSKNKSIASKKMWESEDYRKNFIKTNTGIKKSEETKIKISLSNKDKPTLI